MNIKELVESVSGSTGIEASSVKKVIEATISTLNKQLDGREPVKLQGLGTFARRPGKLEGKPDRVVFRPWLTKEQKRAKKQGKKEKKLKKAESAGAE